MSVYAEDIEIHIDTDVPFEADYNPCEEAAPPDLTGKTFEFTLTPVDGTGAPVMKNCITSGSKILWSVFADDLAGRLGEVFRAQVRQVDLSSKRVWLQFQAKVVP